MAGGFERIGKLFFYRSLVPPVFVILALLGIGWALKKSRENNTHLCGALSPFNRIRNVLKVTFAGDPCGRCVVRLCFVAVTEAYATGQTCVADYDKLSKHEHSRTERMCLPEWYRTLYNKVTHSILAYHFFPGSTGCLENSKLIQLNRERNLLERLFFNALRRSVTWFEAA